MHLQVEPQQQLRATHSTSTLPSLSYASSSQDSLSDDSPRVHNAKRFGQVPPAPSRSASLPTVPLQSAPPAKPVRSKKRLRVDSNNATVPPGFPYLNSSFAIDRYLQHSDNSCSSDDVDLDLSGNFVQTHVGIDMGQAQTQDWWDDLELEASYQRPVSSASVSQLRTTRCRSSTDLSTQAAASSAGPGWSFNRTDRLSVDELPSLRTKRTGASPLTILLQKAAGALHSPTSSIPSSLFSSRRDSKAFTDLSSPLSDSLRTPRSPLAFTPQVTVVGEATELEEFGQLSKQALSATTTYRTAPTAPISLMSTLQSTYQTPLMSPPPESPGLMGLGLERLQFPAPAHDPSPSLDARADPVFRPRSPASSIGSPSPNSPLLADHSPELRPQAHFESPAPTSSSRLSRLFAPRTRNNLPDSPRAHLGKFVPAWSAPRTLLENTSPAKLCFWFGFLLPVLYVFGGFCLRSDGELPDTRGGICRCPARRSKAAGDEPHVLDCPADVHRALRLLGARSTGQGLLADARQGRLDQQEVALLNVQLPRRSVYVVANRVMAVLTGSCMVAAMALGFFVVAGHW